MNSETYISSDSKPNFKLNLKANLDSVKLIFLLVFVAGAFKVYLLVGYNSFNLNCVVIHLQKEAGGWGGGWGVGSDQPVYNSVR